MKFRSTQVVALAFFIGFVFMGCASIVSHDSRTTYGHHRSAPAQDTLRQIRPGETTKEWVLQTFGTPTSEKRLDDGAEILRYEYTHTTRNRFHLLFIINIDNSRVVKENLYIEVRDGIVKRYWRD
ncbi:MAG: hypothetical protein V3S89_10855 [Desulfobacterales bacterium]